MNEIQGIKIKGRHVKLIQAVCTPGRGYLTIIKAVFIGVKEEVKAVCADVLDKQSTLLEDDLYPRLDPDRRFWPRVIIRKIPQFDYDVGEIFYPASLATIVTGNDATIAGHAFPTFQENYGASIPLLKEYSPILWDLAVTNGYITEIVGMGLPADERVYTLQFPKLEVFEQHLLKQIPHIYALARKIVREEMPGIAHAA